MSNVQDCAEVFVKLPRDTRLGGRMKKSLLPPSEQREESTAAINALYHPFPRQEQFHGSRVKYRLFGGAAVPGKTKALLWEAIRQALKSPGCDTLLLRRTFPELESSLLAQFRRDVPRDL
jgi:hypothetical protein